MKIYVKTTNENILERVRAYIDAEISTDCNLSGAEYEIKHEYWCWIDEDEDYLDQGSGMRLLSGINDIVESCERLYREIDNSIDFEDNIISVGSETLQPETYERVLEDGEVLDDVIEELRNEYFKMWIDEHAAVSWQL